MNRRSFIQKVTGLAAGIFAAFAPSKAAESSSSPPVACGVMTPSAEPKECGEWAEFTVDLNHEIADCLKPTPPKFTHVCYCHKPNKLMCNYSACPDYSPGNKKPYKDEYE